MPIKATTIRKKRENKKEEKQSHIRLHQVKFPMCCNVSKHLQMNNIRLVLQLEKDARLNDPSMNQILTHSDNARWTNLKKIMFSIK